MEPSQVAIATVTWARTAEEDARLRRSLSHLGTLGFPVTACDAGSSPSFIEFVGTLQGLEVIRSPGPGLVAQVQTSVAAAGAHGRPFVLYVEPDKEVFFDGRLREFVSRAPDGGQPGVVLASRSDESLATYPPMQRYTEGVINYLCGTLIGRQGDYSYGPFLMHRALLPAVAGFGAHLGWGWRHAAFSAAARAGLDVVHVSGDYPCPADQRVEDDAERAHRIRQLSQNLLGLIEPGPTSPPRPSR